MSALADWIRRRRATWLERKADEIECEFAGTPYGGAAAAEASRMRARADALRDDPGA